MVKDASKTFVVGIGASAGGLEPMRDMLHHASCHGSMCFIVASHVPRYSSNDLARILGRATNMTTRQIEDGMLVENCTLYTIPPNKYVYVDGAALRLADRPSEPTNLAANFLFASLAKTFKQNAIAVVLSGGGLGADGSEGIKLIKNVGGHTYAQEPATAQFPDMPEAAIATGCIDSVLDPETIGRELSLVSWAETAGE